MYSNRGSWRGMPTDEAVTARQATHAFTAVAVGSAIAETRSNSDTAVGVGEGAAGRGRARRQLAAAHSHIYMKSSEHVSRFECRRYVFIWSYVRNSIALTLWPTRTIDSSLCIGECLARMPLVRRLAEQTQGHVRDHSGSFCHGARCRWPRCAIRAIRVLSRSALASRPYVDAQVANVGLIRS